MKCEEIQHLLPAYLDAELDIVHSLAVEQHLKICQACIRACSNEQMLRSSIRESDLYFPAPASLQQRIDQALPRNVLTISRPRRLTSWPWLSAAALVLILLGALGFWGLASLRSNPSNDSHMAQAVVNSHERSLVSGRLVDQPTSDPAVLKSWFENKLGFSPPVINLTLQGYTLIGGRQDFLDNQEVAAIVYKCDSHVINLFIWPAAQGIKQRTLSLQGYYLTHWTNYGMDCWAVADLDEDQLRQFARLINQHLETYL